MEFFSFLFGKKKEEAKLKSSTEQPFHMVKKETVDWRNSEPHLLLLSQFLYGQNAKDAIPPHWEGILGELPQRAVDRFILEGWLVPASLSTKLDRTFSATEIKKLLKERGLRVSGPKGQGIERLLTSDPEGMEAKVSQLDIVECSSEARIMAERFVIERKARKEAAQGNCLKHLRRGNLQGASLTVAQFEARQTFSSKVGEIDCNVEFLKVIFHSRPKILTGLAESEWEPLRIGAAMMSLWGTSKATKWLPTNFVGIPRFKHDTAANMILIHAYYRQSISSYLKEGRDVVKKVEVIGAPDSCSQCKKIAGRTYSINTVPELPYEKCTHEWGCHCVIAPVA